MLRYKFRVAVIQFTFEYLTIGPSPFFNQKEWVNCSFRFLGTRANEVFKF